MSVTDSELEIVVKLTDDYVARLRRGECPSVAQYVIRYPHLAAAIRDMLPLTAMLEDVASPDYSETPSGHALPATPEAEPPGRLGDYRILGEIGRGGMGIVYEAEHIRLKRHVALKVLQPGSRLAAGNRQRFEREARTAAMLHHSNIVPVFEVGDEDGTTFYAMQFIRGRGLDEVLDALRRENPGIGDGAAPWLSAVQRLTARAPPGPPRPQRRYWNSVASIGIQVADAIAYAHDRGTLHRDLKPSNLLLDSQGVVWVSDFGLAQLDGDAGLTQSGEFVGTLRYVAPERFEGLCDSRSDIYSLGLTLYELATFRPAFNASARHRLIHKVTQQEPPRPRRVNPAIPRDLETILLKAIARDPARRYQTAAQLQADLVRFVDDKPITARRSGFCERTAKAIRRRPTVAILSGLLLLSVAAGFVLVTWKWKDAERHRALATEQAGRNEMLAQRQIGLRRQAEDARRAETLHTEAARRQAVEAQQVADFLIGLFQASDPLGLSGYRFGPPPSRPDVLTAEDLLRLGTQRVRAELADAPELQATLMDHLGRTWLSRGSIEDAEPLLQAALDWRRQAYGMRHRDTAMSLTALGTLRYVQGNYDEAVSLLRQATTNAEQTLDVSDSNLAMTKFLLACVLLESRGGPATIREAREVFEQLVALLRGQAQQRPRDLMFALTGLAMARQVSQDFTGALHCLAQATTLLSRAPQSDEVTAALILSVEAVTSWKLGNRETAQQQTDRCISQFQEILGRYHPAVNYFQVYTAQLIHTVGDLERAEEILRTGVVDARRAYGPQPRTAETMKLLAEVLVDRREWDEAESICREALSITTTILGPDHRQTQAIQRLISRIADRR